MGHGNKLLHTDQYKVNIFNMRYVFPKIRSACPNLSNSYRMVVWNILYIATGCHCLEDFDEINASKCIQIWFVIWRPWLKSQIHGKKNQSQKFGFK